MTDHLHLFLRDETHRDDVEQHRTPRTSRPPLLLPRLIATVCTLFGLQGGAAALRRISSGIALRGGEQAAQALVTRKYEDKNEDSPYHIVYSYKPHDAQESYQRDTKLSRAAWRATCEGCTIDILYSPERPDISRTRDEWTLAGGLLMLGFMLLLLIAGLLQSWSALRAQRRHWRLRRHGTLRMGTILGISNERKGEGMDLHITLRVELGDSDALSYTWREDNPLDKTPQVGQRVAALYCDPTLFELV
jgi:hypothetical protein